MIIYFLCSLVLIIFCHELAHLLVAKKLGVGVDIFSIGFGRPLYRKEYRGTIYQITPLLLGGYTKLRDELKNSNDPHAFINQPYHKKVLIALAGVTTNILMGLIIFLIGKFIHSYALVYFGFLSFILGVTNTIPIIPCLDGGYLLYIPICFKIWGKEKGLKIFAILNKISFTILMLLQILAIPYLIYLIKQGGL